MNLPTIAQALSTVRPAYCDGDTADVLTIERWAGDDNGYHAVTFQLRVLRPYYDKNRGLSYCSALGPDAGVWLRVRYQRYDGPFYNIDGQPPAEDQPERWCRSTVNIHASEPAAAVATGRLLSMLMTGRRLPPTPDRLQTAARRLGAFPVRTVRQDPYRMIQVVDVDAPVSETTTLNVVGA